MCTYLIHSIQPKFGQHSITHERILERYCQILRLEIGRRGWLLVDIGDAENGPHRIALSIILRTQGAPGDEIICIETEFSIYQLRKNRAE